ncbi:MAG TPA: flagellar hook-associated protein FlgL [Gemmatimonadaceae bacterium]
MRITSNMITNSQITAIQTNLDAMMKANDQVSSGLRFQDASEDPAAATQVMGTKASLRALDQYKSNVTAATNRVTQEDSVLQQINDLLGRVKQLGISQATDTATDQTKTVANAEVQQIFKQLVTLGNTKVGGEYLFGGDQSTTAPFSATGAGATIDYTTTNPQGQRSISIAPGQSMASTHDGTQVFVSSGILDSVKQLARSLDPTSTTYGQTGTSDALNSIDGAMNSLQTLIGETGANEQQLSSTTQNLTALKTNVTTFQNDLQGVDVEQAMTELTTRQTAYQAAMLAMSKVSDLTLTNYLK